MGWIIRKSVKLGPFRVNLSNSGISTSVGAKGARINFGKRGTYLNVGTGGIRYRQKIGDNVSQGTPQTFSHRIFWLVVIAALILIISLALYANRPVATNKTHAYWVVISKNSVHVRETPSISGRIIKTVNCNDRFKLVEQTGTDWFKISLDGSTVGFVRVDLAYQEKLPSDQLR